jgi:hypothetical protein
LVEALVDMPSTLSALGNAPATIILFAAFAALSALARQRRPMRSARRPSLA